MEMPLNLSKPNYMMFTRPRLSRMSLQLSVPLRGDITGDAQWIAESWVFAILGIVLESHADNRSRLKASHSGYDDNFAIWSKLAPSPSPRSSTEGLADATVLLRRRGPAL